MVTEVYLESRVQDTETSAFMGFAIRKIRGSNLESVKDSLTLEDVEKQLDNVAGDAVDTITSN